MRIGIANIYQETNTFATTLTMLADFEAFGLLVGGALIERFQGTATTLGGFWESAQEQGFTAVPLLYAEATPGGIVSPEAFEAIKRRLISALVNEAGRLDGVLLGLHGAMVAQAAPDADGELLVEVRRVVGPRVPIVATLDLHANLSPAMLRAADALIGYDTYPHVDTRERAIEAAQPIARAIILAEGPGTTGSERSLRDLPFRKIRRPAWPLDLDAGWADVDADTFVAEAH